MLPEIWKNERDAFIVGPEKRVLRTYLPIETSWFKTIFTAERGSEAEITIFALSRYCLYLNGEMLSNGPLKGDRNTSYVDRIDLTDKIVTGTNVLSVKVTSYPPAEAYLYGQERSNSGPYAVMGTASGPCLMVTGHCGDYDLSTGYAAWYVWNDLSVDYDEHEPGFIMGGNERIDVSQLSHHTLDTSLTDFNPVVQRWTHRAGLRLNIPFYALYERTIPPLLLEAPRGFTRIMSATEEGCIPIDPLKGEITCAPNGRYAVDLDAGEMRTAYIALSIRGGNHAKVRLVYTEAYANLSHDGPYSHIEKGKRDDCEHFAFHGLTDTVYPDGRDWTYQPFWFRTFRFVRLIIETANEPLTLSAPTYRVTRYPLEINTQIYPKQDWIKALWDISVRTLQLCTHETHEDCPFYEQLQYIFDTRLQMLFTYALSTDTRMAERVIFMFHSSLLPEGLPQSRYPSTETQIIPCFALHWIGMLHDHYRHTGRTDLIRRYRTTLESILDWFGRKRGTHGLAEWLGYWEFFDWAPEWSAASGTPNPAMTEGISVSENLVYAYFLGIGADLLDVIGHTQDADFYREDRRGVLNAVQSLCWDETRQYYKEAPNTNEFSQHAQFYAVLNGMVTGKEATQLMYRTINDPTLIQATFPQQYALFRALEKVGLYEETEKLWSLWQSLLDQELTTVPEIPGPYTRSDCHAWGALLLHEYPSRILGVYPAEPGFETIGIRPMGLYLGQAKGEVVTPKGIVSVQWEITNGRFTIEARWPKGIPVRITLPDNSVFESSDGSFRI